MKLPKQAYMTAFKELAAKRVKRIKDGQRTSIATRLGLGDQTLRNRVKTSAEGKLGGAGGREVTPEEIAESMRRRKAASTAARTGGCMAFATPPMLT